MLRTSRKGKSGGNGAAAVVDPAAGGYFGEVDGSREAAAPKVTEVTEHKGVASCSEEKTSC